MGIIVKQSVSNMITTYVGFGIGAINVLWLYPHFLAPNYYGLVSYLLTAGNLLWPIMAFGGHNTLIKFFSSFSSKEEQDRLLTMVLLIPLLFGGLAGLLGVFFYDSVLLYFEGENELVQPYAWLIFVIAISTAYFEIFFAWNKIFLKSIFGNAMKEVFHRLGISLLLLLLYYEYISLPFFIYASAGVYGVRTLLMMASAFSTYLPHFQFRFPVPKREIIHYSVLIFVAGTVSVVLFDLDKFMIERFLPIENVAIYGIGVYIAAVIAVPYRAMQQITNPVTANYINGHKTQELNLLYKRTSLTLLVISGLIFVFIVGNIHQLYTIIPETYRAGIEIAVLISVIKLYDNMLGNNISILFNSNYYHFVLYSGVLLAFVALGLNLLLIPLFGIYGAAYATFIAYFLYNTIKLIFVYVKFQLQPFSKNTLILLVIITVFSGFFYSWDFDFHPILNILLKSCIIAVGYVFLVLFLKISSDITTFIKSIQPSLKNNR